MSSCEAQVASSANQCGGELYAGLEVFQTNRLDQPILPVECYPHLARVVCVAIGHFEAWHLACTHPVLWRETRQQGALELCALLIRREATAPRDRELRPRLLAAHPFALARLRGGDGDALTVMYDRAPNAPAPDLQVDPAVDATGAFTALARERMDALCLYAAGLPATRSITEELMAQSLIQPWEGSLTIAGRAHPLIGAHRLADDWFDRLDRSRFSAEQWPHVMKLLQAHLISLRHTRLGQDRVPT